MLPAIFNDTRDFRAAFTRGLGNMLLAPNLGGFILVLANATYDPSIFKSLREPLHTQYRRLSGLMRLALQQGRPMDGSPDDVVVFLKLMALGWDRLRSSAFRRAGPWEVQFNHLRAFRPPRLSNATVDALTSPFCADAFNFNKGFLRNEVLWEGELRARSARLLYNKFPFADLHGLLVVEPAAELPQFLYADTHRYLWALAAALGRGLPGVGFGYNAYGAYASVNHLHFQMYVREEGSTMGPRYPIESENWRHNGGGDEYPLLTLRFDDPDEAIGYIEELHVQRRTYNLLYRPGSAYVTARATQGTYAHSAWTAGFAWAEVAGAIATFNGRDFAALDDAAIRAEFDQLAVD